MRPKRLQLALLALAGLHLVVALAGFLAPYPYAEQDRSLPWAPPTRIHFVDAAGKFHWRPFIYQQVPAPSGFGYVEDHSRIFPLRFWVPGEPYRLLGLIPAERRLLGVDEPARLFLAGSDGFGRDQWSRLLHGGRISLLAGLLAATLSLSLGLLVGALAGFYGRLTDAVLMRLAELFLSLPWLYLLLGARAFLPLSIAPSQAFLLIVLLVGAIGWARPARMIRGVVLSARERGYVLAARGFGASDRHILWRHILPQTRGLLLTQAAILAPRFILAEVTLSFLGLGVGEPLPSLGSLLGELQKAHVLASYGWMFVPAVALVAVFLAYHGLARALSSAESRKGVIP